jgi:hypothetical protein
MALLVGAEFPPVGFNPAAVPDPLTLPVTNGRGSQSPAMSSFYLTVKQGVT